jgi:hypothetical protein
VRQSLSDLHDTIPLRADRMLGVVEIKPGSNADDNPVLVVEPA